MLDLTAVPVLVVGGGQVALRKIEGLVTAHAEVTVVAPSVIEEIARLPVRVIGRAYASTDLEAMRLVVTSTDDPAVNAAVAADAAARGIWVNSADDPANCTFTLPAVARDGAVTVAVGTGGSSPALASAPARRVANAGSTRSAPPQAAATLAAERKRLQANGVPTESVDWTEPHVRAALRQRP